MVSLCAGTESGVPSSESNTVTSIPAVEREANLLAGKEAKEAKRARRRKMIKLQLQHNSCPEAKISHPSSSATTNASDLGSRPGLRGPRLTRRNSAGEMGSSSLQFLIPGFLRKGFNLFINTI